MLPLWTFRSYLTAAGKDDVEDWYSRESEQVQAALDVVLEYLQQRPRSDWRRPDFDELSGKKMKGISEIRLKVEKIQYRIFGFFGPKKNEYTLLIGATKKGTVYKPTEALDSAVKRRKEILKDGSRCCVLSI